MTTGQVVPLPVHCITGWLASCLFIYLYLWIYIRRQINWELGIKLKAPPLHSTSIKSIHTPIQPAFYVVGGQTVAPPEPNHRWILLLWFLQGSREPGLYVLDCLFSVMVVGSLVVLVWRGVWVFLDILIYPDNKTLSAFSSLVSAIDIEIRRMIIIAIEWHNADDNSEVYVVDDMRLIRRETAVAAIKTNVARES